MSHEEPWGNISFFRPAPVEGVEDHVMVRAKFRGLDIDVTEYSVSVFESDVIGNCMKVLETDPEYTLGAFDPAVRGPRGVGIGFWDENQEISVHDVVGKYVALTAGD